MGKLAEKLEQARKVSWEWFGKRITFYLPGMFSYDGISGKYLAVSVTGNRCSLQCEHCKGKLLQSMIAAVTPDELLQPCLKVSERGNLGVLVSGGCDSEGRLPWESFIPAIDAVKKRTKLYISTIRYQRTCCSVSRDFSTKKW